MFVCITLSICAHAIYAYRNRVLAAHDNYKQNNHTYVLSEAIIVILCIRRLLPERPRWHRVHTLCFAVHATHTPNT